MQWRKILRPNVVFVEAQIEAQKGKRPGVLNLYFQLYEQEYWYGRDANLYAVYKLVFIYLFIYIFTYEQSPFLQFFSLFKRIYL